jgi:hypothetical protein
MAETLVSPGVSVSVVDESQYASPGTGTIPLIVFATRENKVDPTATFTDGIALYTKKQFANQIISITSQRELTQYFGNASFRISGGGVVNGDETNEYGLLSAYSYLGQGSRVFALRADIDLAQLEPRAVAPTGPIAPFTYWIDVDAAKWGIHEYSSATARWNYKVPSVVEFTESALVTAPTATPVEDEYAVLIRKNTNGSVTFDYYIGTNGGSLAWTKLTTTLTFAPHYSVPTSPSDGDVWVKTTTPSNGISIPLLRADISSVFQDVAIAGTKLSSDSSYIPQDGSSTVQPVFVNGQAVIEANTTTDTVEIKLVSVVNGTTTFNSFTTADVLLVQNNEPTGEPSIGTLWFNSAVDALDIYINSGSTWTQLTSAQKIYSSVAPSTRADGTSLQQDDVWIDTNEVEYPVLYKFNDTTSSWELHENTDQSSEYGVLFADISIETGTSDVTDYANQPTPSINPVIYPTGMLAVNMAKSSNTVKVYSEVEIVDPLDSENTVTINAWVNAVANSSDGKGAFGRLAQHNAIAQRMQAAIVGNDILREDIYNFTLLAAPNFPELTSELIELNQARGETGFVIIDAPMRKNPTQVVSWINNTNAPEDGEEGLVSIGNPYSAIYYPSLRATTPDGFTTTVPASYGVLYQYAYNDNVAFPWFAPAGLTRGVVTNASGVGYIDSASGEFRAISLSKGQRDNLYTAKINPIANFAGEGIVIFGNKSLYNQSSALDRVNVARLVAYIRERFEVIGRPFLFEPNTKATRDRAKATYENFLFDILSKRGISDFIVQCDSSNNSSVRIDRNELWIDVAIVPTKSIEFIYIPIRLVNTGEI